MCPHRLRFDQLPGETLDRIVEALEPFVSPERRARIDEALVSRTRDLVLVMEDIYDDHNASAVLRSADAFGVHEVHVVERNVRFLVQAKTSIGAHKWIDVRKHKGTPTVYEELAARGYRIWASSLHGDVVTLDQIDPTEKIALVFGNEHQGLSPEATRAAHKRFRIPMHGFVESLNVSVATAISMYQVLARKRAANALSGLSRLEAKQLRAEWFALSVRGARPILSRAGLPTGTEVPSPIAFTARGEPDEDDEDEDGG